MTASIRNIQGYALSRQGGVAGVRNVVGYALTRPATEAVLEGLTDYRKPRQDLLHELVSRTNPGFLDMLPAPSDVVFSGIKAITPTDGVRNTSVVVAGAIPGQFRDTATVTYRRIDIGKLFKGRTVTLTKYTTTSVLTKQEFIDLFLEQTGVRLYAEDFTNTGWGLDVLAPLTMTAGCWCYTGTVNVIWTKGKRNIADLVGDRKLNARNWPQAMIDFQNGTKPQGELLYYHLDFSSQRSQFNSWTADYVYNGAGSGIAVIANAMNVVLTAAGLENVTGSQKVSTKPGIDNIKLSRYALPNAAIPEANSAEYGWCLVLEPQEPGWFFGKLILHYN